MPERDRRRALLAAASAIATTVVGPDGIGSARAADDPVPPIVRAAEQGDLAAVDALLSKGIDPNATGSGGGTALMAAARRGRHDIARTLLAHGAARDQQDRSGKRAFDFAVERGHSDLIALLRDAS